MLCWKMKLSKGFAHFRQHNHCPKSCFDPPVVSGGAAPSGELAIVPPQPLPLAAAAAA